MRASPLRSLNVIQCDTVPYSAYSTLSEGLCQAFFTHLAKPRKTSHASTMDDLAAAAAATTTTAANRGTAQFEAVDAETRAVMQSRINPSSRAHYDSENTKFILWLFDNREHYSDFLQPALLNEIALQLERDEVIYGRVIFGTRPSRPQNWSS